MFRGLRRMVVKLRLGYCPRFKARPATAYQASVSETRNRGVNGSLSYAYPRAKARLFYHLVLRNSELVLPYKLQFAELYGEPKGSGIQKPEVRGR